MIEGEQEIVMRLLDEEHLSRIEDLKLAHHASCGNPADLERRLAREHLRYERARSAFRAYNLSVEEWEDEEGIDDPQKYHHWRNYL